MHISALFLLFASVSLSLGSPWAPPAPKTSIAVVGAGYAGLAAVGRLRELGFEDVTLFEGLNRVGGRVFSIPYGKGRLQQGAQWINGHNNSIYRIADKLGLVIGELADNEVFEKASFFDGHCGLTKEIVNKFHNFVAPMRDRWEDLAEDRKNYALSFDELYDKDFREFLERKNRTHKDIHLLQGLSRYYRGYWEGENGAFDEFALANLGEWDDGEGESKSYVMNPMGYFEVTKYLKGRVPDEIVKYNHFVKKIDYSGEQTTITVEEAGRTFDFPKKFDHVIVTSSIGHLKKYSLSLFNPPLPARKQEAIDSLGYGNLLKVFLIYDKPWWSYNGSAIAALRIQGCSTTPGLMKFMHTFKTLEWDENVLVAFVSATGTEMIDKVPDAELVKEITEHLRVSMDVPDAPEPKQIIRQHWVSDKLFLGAYSFIASEAALLPGGAYNRMSEPVASKLFFAGEGTHPFMYMTTVGAFDSGVREADRIAKLSQMKVAPSFRLTR